VCLSGRVSTPTVLSQVCVSLSVCEKIKCARPCLSADAPVAGASGAGGTSSIDEGGADALFAMEEEAAENAEEGEKSESSAR
jgi:hypothetical protein